MYITHCGELDFLLKFMYLIPLDENEQHDRSAVVSKKRPWTFWYNILHVLVYRATNWNFLLIKLIQWSFKLSVRIIWPRSILFSLLIFIALLDDLDKEVNNYIMRCKEWYGWHFPELAKIVQDNIAFCKTVQRIGS